MIQVLNYQHDSCFQLFVMALPLLFSNLPVFLDLLKEQLKRLVILSGIAKIASLQDDLFILMPLHNFITS